MSKREQTKMPEKLKKFLPSVIMPAVFETEAIVPAVTPGNVFYPFNFKC